MKSKEIEALISYRMERSRESIRAAEIMFENDMLTFSMNRVYYSMFYAVQALLVLHKVSFSKYPKINFWAPRHSSTICRLVPVFKQSLRLLRLCLP
jgi:uncharacterized protein (UPF0332 family)